MLISKIGPVSALQWVLLQAPSNTLQLCSVPAVLDVQFGILNELLDNVLFISTPAYCVVTLRPGA
jgi:hypothetical protein